MNIGKDWNSTSSSLLLFGQYVIFVNGSETSILLFQAAAQLAQTFLTDILILELDDFFGLTAENAGGLVLFQYDSRAINVNFKGIFLCNVQGAAQLNGQYNAAQFVNFTNDASGFHFHRITSYESKKFTTVFNKIQHTL